MIIFPAIDLVQKKAVRLYQGDYQKMTVYSEDPVSVAMDFRNAGASHIHLVDLEGARDGTTSNLPVILGIKKETGLFTEVGGGIRSMETVEKYLEAGVDRVILGTAAVTDPDFLQAALSLYRERIAVGIDLRDGFVAIRGWTEKSAYTAGEFVQRMQDLGVSNLIVTDISRDGAMKGTNTALYEELSRKYRVNITASGGVSSIADVKRLSGCGLYGAIIGKAYYTGAIDLREAILATEENAPENSAFDR